jgi:hypothetical protein
MDEKINIGRLFWLIPIVGLFMAYFEVYYAWVSTHAIGSGNN